MQALLQTLPAREPALVLQADGHPNKTICRQLGPSPSTVKAPLQAIFRQLGLRSRTQAVLVAARPDLRWPMAAPPP